MPGFLSSNLYYKYLSDLINSVRGDEFVNAGGQSQGGSSDNERPGSQTQVSSLALRPPLPPPAGMFSVCWHLDPSCLIRRSKSKGFWVKLLCSPFAPLIAGKPNTQYFFFLFLFMLFTLQQGSKKAAVKILKNFDEAITVDVASLDPESLYQRPYAG